MLKLSEKTMFFTISIYCQSPFIGVYTHFDSYMPLNFKFSLVCTINFRSLTICSDMPKFHQEICKIKDVFIKNGYSERFIDKCVKTFFNKVCIPERIIQTAEKKQVTIFFTLYGHDFD